jgi:CDP-glucose 4,6-dehydratase
MADRQFWNGKRVLVTGHTGFKGSWLSLWLSEMGAEVSGLSLAPPTEPSLFRLLNGTRSPASEGILDIRDRVAVAARVMVTRPEIVFHLAAQPLVRAGYRDPLGTYETNVQGTANLLDALRIAPDVRAIVVVTTDKVYENPETGAAFRESDPLGGHDPYSASKAAAEIVTASYRQSFFAARRIGIATARAGNVIGGGDWAEDRLVPDAMRAWNSGRSLMVRRPDAVRPWQHVLEPLHGYIRLAEALWEDPDFVPALNFGPDHKAAATVRTLLELARDAYGLGVTEFAEVEEGPHEAGYLMLDSSVAGQRLGYRPCWGLEETVTRTMDWYRRHHRGMSARGLCLNDIEVFEEKLAAQEAGAAPARKAAG